MKAKQQMSMRLELMDYGSKLGYPRLPFAFGKRVPEGEEAWRKFATTASVLKIAPALRNARTRSDYSSPSPMATPPSDDLAARRRANLARARVAKAAKKAAKKEAALSQ